MTADDPATHDLDELVQRLRARIAERREAGLYPDDVADDLDAHFRRIVAHRPAVYDFGQLRELVEKTAQAGGLTAAAISYDSRLPGGDAIHRAVGKVVSRQTAGILEQVQQLAENVVDVLRELVAVLEHHNAHPHAELVGEVDALLERVSALESRASGGPIGLADVRRRLERLEAKLGDDSPVAPYTAGEFDERFRGGSELRERYVSLASWFDGCDPVVDLGFGRGDFLELLRDRGIEVCGVEIDEALVRDAERRGLAVETGDAVEWLASRLDESLGGISMIQVIEHLATRRREEVVMLAARKLRPGGRMVVETINPQSLYVFARGMYVDPSHLTPVHPAYLLFVFEKAGFRDISIEWRSPPPDDEVLQPLGGEGDLERRHDANVARLNQLLFGPQDYAIVATR